MVHKKHYLLYTIFIQLLVLNSSATNRDSLSPGNSIFINTGQLVFSEVNLGLEKSIKVSDQNLSVQFLFGYKIPYSSDGYYGDGRGVLGGFKATGMTTYPYMNLFTFSNSEYYAIGLRRYFKRFLTTPTNKLYVELQPFYRHNYFTNKEFEFDHGNDGGYRQYLRKESVDQRIFGVKIMAGKRIYLCKGNSLRLFSDIFFGLSLRKWVETETIYAEIFTLSIDYHAPMPYEFKFFDPPHQTTSTFYVPWIIAGVKIGLAFKAK